MQCTPIRPSIPNMQPGTAHTGLRMIHMYTINSLQSVVLGLHNHLQNAVAAVCKATRYAWVCNRSDISEAHIPDTIMIHNNPPPPTPSR